MKCIVFNVFREQIDEPASLSMGLEETTSGIVKLDGKIILLLDYEKLYVKLAALVMTINQLQD